MFEENKEVNKYGEITRIKHNGISYILSAEKIQAGYLIDDPFIPFLAFFRTNKTSKKIFNKHIDRYDRVHQMSENLFNVELIRKIIKGFAEYFNQTKPEYICYCNPYGDYYESIKRHRYYWIILNRLGYEFIGECQDEQDYDYYYYQRKTT